MSRMMNTIIAAANAWSGKSVSAPGSPSADFFIPQSPSALTAKSRPGQGHVWVYAACTAIVEPFKAIPIILDEGSKDKIKPVAHPVMDLFASPNPFMAGKNFWEAILWNLLLITMRSPGGQAFVVGNVPTDFSRGEIPDELWVFSDAAVQPKLDAQGVLCGWRVGYGGKVQMDLSLDEVIRIRKFNPYDWKLGLSPLAAAAVEFLQDTEAKEYNLRFLQNGAAPSGQVSLDGQPPARDQWEQIKTEFKNNYSGAVNAGKTLFLPWMLKYESFARSHTDFDFMAQLGWNRDSVLAAYRVNKWAVGISEELNYATAKEAKRQLYENVILPLGEEVLGALNSQWIQNIERRGFSLRMDLTNLQALKEDRTARIRDMRELVDMGWPPAVAAAWLDLDIPTKGAPWLNEDRSQFALFGGGFTEEEETEDDIEDGKAAKRSLPAPKVKTSRASLAKKFVDSLFDPGERELRPIAQRFFVKQRNQMLDRLDAMKAVPKEKGALVSALIPEKAKENAEIIRVYQVAYVHQAKRVLRSLRGELSGKAWKSLNLDSTEDEVRQFLAARLLKLSEVNDTTFRGVEKRLSEIVAEGVERSWTIEEMAAAVRSGIRDVYQQRNRQTSTIARTETAVVTSGVRHEIFRSAGIKRKEWLSARDSRVRDSHAAEDGNTVVLGQKFPVTGLLHPCDPSGPASETINCRCVELAVEDDA